MPPNGFDDLPPDHQEAILRGGKALNDLAFRYALPIILGPPAHAGDPINHASGVICELQGTYAFLTASHVVDAFEERHAVNPSVQCQVGRTRFDPASRICHRDRDLDVVALALSSAEAENAGTFICRPHEWPPALPALGHDVIVAGFPRVIREEMGPAEYGFNSMTLITPVSSVGEHSFACVFERDNWVSASAPPGAKDERDLGGISGGPVFLISRLSITLAGLVTEHNPTLDILRVAALRRVPSTFDLKPNQRMDQSWRDPPDRVIWRN